MQNGSIIKSLKNISKRNINNDVFPNEIIHHHKQNRKSFKNTRIKNQNLIKSQMKRSDDIHSKTNTDNININCNFIPTKNSFKINTKNQNGLTFDLKEKKNNSSKLILQKNKKKLITKNIIKRNKIVFNSLDYPFKKLESKKNKVLSFKNGNLDKNDTDHEPKFTDQFNFIENKEEVSKDHKDDDDESSTDHLSTRIRSDIFYKKSKFDKSSSQEESNDVHHFYGSFEKDSELSSDDNKNWDLDCEETDNLQKPKIKIIKIRKESKTDKKPKQKSLKTGIKNKITTSFCETGKKVMKTLNESVFFNPKLQTVFKYIEEIKISSLKKSIDSKSMEVYILGQEMTVGNVLDWNIKNFKIFTYRKGMNLCFNNQKIDDDCGWGCMIRTGQMILYNMLAKFFISNFKINLETTHKEKKKNEQQKICRELYNKYFDNKNDAIYSFKNIVKVAHQNFNIKLGKFWDSNIFFKVISHINKNFNNLFINYQKKESNSKSIQNKVHKLINSIQIEICKNGFIPDTKVSQILQKKNGKNVIMLSLNLQLGKSKCELKFRNLIFKMIQIKNFCGMISGQNQKAFYLFGYNKKTSDFNHKNSFFMYLDPHVSQDVVNI